MLSIDRIEGNIVVCIDDDGEIVKIDRELVEDNACEGDIIYDDNGRYYVSEEETQAVRGEILALEDELFE